MRNPPNRTRFSARSKLLFKKPAPKDIRSVKDAIALTADAPHPQKTKPVTVLTKQAPRVISLRATINARATELPGAPPKVAAKNTVGLVADRIGGIRNHSPRFLPTRSTNKDGAMN